MSTKQKTTFDFAIKSAPSILFTFLTTPEGLTQWFAEHVDLTDIYYSFFWDGSEEKATLIESDEDKLVRFKMEDMEEGEYLEFKIEKSEISNSTILYVTEFLDDLDIEDQRIFWTTQIDQLKGSIGAGN